MYLRKSISFSVVLLRVKFFTNIKEFVFRIYLLDRIKLIHSTFLMMFLRRGERVAQQQLGHKSENM